MNNNEIPRGTRVLVTGATGFTGSMLTRKLVSSALNVAAIARPSSNIDSLNDLNISWFRGDVFDPKTVENAAKDADYIFHLATAYRQPGSSSDYLEKVHVTSTKLLAAEALKNKSFKRFVHVSTVGVHGHIDQKEPADETYRFKPGDSYQTTKAQAETWIREFSKQNSLPLTVIRPTGIFGPGDKRLFKLFKMASKRFFPLLGQGNCYYHLIHVDDLTEAIIKSASSPRANGEIFICGNNDPIKLEEIGRIIASELGRKISVIRLPVWPFYLLAIMCEALCKPLKISPPIFRRRVAFFTKDRLFDTKKMRTALGYEPKYSNKEGLIQTTRWYVDHGWLRKDK